MERNIMHTEQDGYLYPDLKLPEQQEVMIGRFGRKHKNYLKKHRKVVYYNLLTGGELTEYLEEVDRQAQEMFDDIVSKSKGIHGVTEKLKAEEPMEWVRRMNSITNTAEEFVLREIVYV